MEIKMKGKGENQKYLQNKTCYHQGLWFLAKNKPARLHIQENAVILAIQNENWTIAINVLVRDQMLYS